MKSRQPNGRESVFVHSSVEWRLAGQRRGAEEGVMRRNWYCEEWGARKGFGVARKHRWNVDIQSQNTRISGKGKSVSYDTHLLTYCLNYGLSSSTPTSAEHEECKDKQPPTLTMLQASGNEL